MARPEPLPIKVDRITARVLETLSPSRRAEMDKRLYSLRQYGDTNSVQFRFDAVDIGHPQVRSITIKATSKKVETDIYLNGLSIRNGRQIQLQRELPLSVIASLKKRAANDVIDTELLEGHTVLWARENEINLKEEEWVDLAQVKSTGQDQQPITLPELIDGLEKLGIAQIDAVFLHYVRRISKLRHIVLARVAAYINKGSENSVSTQLHDLTDWQNGERAFFSIANGTLAFTVQTSTGSARYSAGRMSVQAERVGYTAQHIVNMCYHLPRESKHGHSRATKNPYRTIEKIRENLEKYNYLG